jgi:hypothetical protein
MNEVNTKEWLSGLEGLCAGCLERLFNQPGHPGMHQWLYLLVAREHFCREQEKQAKLSIKENLETTDAATLSAIAKNIEGKFEFSERAAAVDSLVDRIKTMDAILSPPEEIE